MKASSGVLAAAMSAAAKVAGNCEARQSLLR